MPQPTPQPTLGPPIPEPKKYDFPIATAIAKGWGTASLITGIAMALISLPAIAQPGCNGQPVKNGSQTFCLTTTERGETRVDLMGSTVSVTRLKRDGLPVATLTMTGEHTRTVPDNGSLRIAYSSRSAIEKIAEVSNLVNAIVTNDKAKTYLGF
jgi:hypothetical protein